MNEIINILKISLTRGIGNVSVLKFLEYIKIGSIESYNNKDIVEIFELLKKVNGRIKVPLMEEIEIAEEWAKQIYELSNENGIKIFPYNSEGYPKLLYDLNDAPAIVHVKGNIKALDSKPTVAVIGTRKPSSYGEKLGARLVEILIENDVNIVSGLALGCDTIGHLESVNRHKQTIAVLAGGLQSIYPKENKVLAQLILENDGLLISEMPFGQNPDKNSFVQRDRIQSGLSYATMIIQTAIKGGTLHTAKFTLDQKRLLACIFPKNHIENTHEMFMGNKELIKQGAISLDSPEAIQELINKVKEKYKFHKSNFDKNIRENMNNNGQTILF